MDTLIIASLYEYGAWASERLLAQAAGLPDADLTRQFSKGCQPILPTFVHLVSADRRWLARWRNETPPAPLTTADLPTLDAVRRAWEPLGAERRAYLAALTRADLEAPIRFTGDRGTVVFPRWQGILQCANHGTQHRSEIAAMLTDAGRSPGDLDYILSCQPRA